MNQGKTPLTHNPEALRISRRIPRSEKWEPLQFTRKHFRPSFRGGEELVEDWENRIYAVTVRRYEFGWALDESKPWTKIGISCHNGDPRHDWREFQLIKNDVVGPDWEAIELYPSEDRLCDPSNYFLLWAAPKINVGIYEKRRVMLPEHSIAPQRGWKQAPRNTQSRIQ